MNSQPFRLLFFLMLISQVSFSQIETDRDLLVRPYVGLSTSQGDFKDFIENGAVFGVSIDKYISDKFALGIDFNHQSNANKNPFDFNRIPSIYQLVINENSKWNTTSITFGPTYKIGFGKFLAEFYSKAGISYVKSATANANLLLLNNRQDILSFPEQERTGFGLTSGIRLNYKLSPKISLFLNPQLVNTFKNVDYCNCGLDEALNLSETQDPQAVLEQIPIKASISPNYINLNAGISIKLGGVKTDEIAQNLNPQICTIKFVESVCDNSNIILKFGSNWSNMNPLFTYTVDLFDGATLIASKNSQPLSLNYGVNNIDFNMPNSYTGNNLKAVFKIFDLNGVEVCSSQAVFTVPPCVNYPSCNFILDPTNYACEPNAVNYSTNYSWLNLPVGTVIDIVSNINGTPITVNSASFPFTITTANQSGNITANISIPNNYVGSPIFLIIQMTNPITGQTINCGGTDVLFLPECEEVPFCDIEAEAKSCLLNGKTEIEFTGRWYNYTNPGAYTLNLELFDVSGNPVNVNISNNGQFINGATGTRTLLADLSDYEGQTITVIYKICYDGGVKDCCIRELKIDVPKCCIDCYDVEEEETTQKNQQGNMFNVTGYLMSGDPIEKVSIQLEYFRAKNSPNKPVIKPVNFEFSNTSKINGTSVNLIGSLSGYRSNLIIETLTPNVGSLNFDLNIDNYLNKEMIQYKIKITIYTDKGQSCTRYFKN